MSTKRTAGFSLVELMVTLAVAGVLLSLAVPSFTEVIRNNRMAVQANDLIAALNYARSEAVKRTTPVRVVASGSDWASGWEVRLTDETVLRMFPAVSSGMTLAEGASATAITYEGTGRAAPTASFSLCDVQRSGESGRRITLLASGRVNVSNLTCS